MQQVNFFKALCVCVCLNLHKQHSKGEINIKLNVPQSGNIEGVEVALPIKKGIQNNQLPCVILLLGKDGYNKSRTTWITACIATSNQVCIQFLDFFRSKLVAETSLLWIVFFYLSKSFTRLHTSWLLKNVQKIVTSTETCTILTDFQLLTPQDKA